jgi:hypothetical protein
MATQVDAAVEGLTEKNMQQQKELLVTVFSMQSM